MAESARELISLTVVFEDLPFKVIGVEHPNIVEDRRALSSIHDELASKGSDIEEDAGTRFLAHLFDFLLYVYSLQLTNARVVFELGQHSCECLFG